MYTCKYSDSDPDDTTFQAIQLNVALNVRACDVHAPPHHFRPVALAPTPA